MLDASTEHEHGIEHTVLYIYIYIYVYGRSDRRILRCVFLRFD